MFDIAVCDDSELDRNLLIEEIRKCEKYRETVRFHQYSSGKELLAAMELALLQRPVPDPALPSGPMQPEYACFFPAAAYSFS